MDFDSCYNCGEQGHFASSCPRGVDLSKAPARGNHPQQFKAVPARPRHEQARINEHGVALCRAALEGDDDD